MKKPKIHPSVHMSPDVTVVGDVEIGEQSSVWFGSVVRGDVHSIRIGKRTNLQDHTIVHVTNGKFSTTIEDDVTIGHRVTLHGCHVKSRVLVGIGAILLDGVVVESDSMIAAGSLLTPGTHIPPGVLAMGVPARVVRDLSEEERKYILKSSKNYIEY